MHTESVTLFTKTFPFCQSALGTDIFEFVLMRIRRRSEPRRSLMKRTTLHTTKRTFFGTLHESPKHEISLNSRHVVFQLIPYRPSLIVGHELSVRTSSSSTQRRLQNLRPTPRSMICCTRSDNFVSFRRSCIFLRRSDLMSKFTRARSLCLRTLPPKDKCCGQFLIFSYLSKHSTSP